MVRNRFQVIKRRPREERTAPDGFVFDSVGEMRRWEELKELQRRGVIRNLERQVRYEIPIIDSRGKRRHYRPDFQYEESSIDAHGLSGRVWRLMYEEYKGVDDVASQLRRGSFIDTYLPREHDRFRLTGPASVPKKRKKKKVVEKSDE